MSIFDFSDYIASHTHDFVGREWVFDEIDTWLADPDAPRYFIITGEPGIGKTAIAARLTQIRELDAYHFCIARQAGTIDPLNFARFLSHQLTRIDDFAQNLLEEQGTQVDVTINVRENYGQIIGVQIETLVVEAPSASIAFNRVVLDPLRRLYAGDFEQSLVILVDALDETVQQRGPDTIVDLLAGARGLPPQVRFVLTSRPESAALRHFEQLNIPHLVLDAGGTENQADVQTYVCYRFDRSETLRSRLAEEAVDDDTFVERVIEACQGNFLYLVWMLRSVEEGTQRFDSPETLPEGLDGIYREFLRTRAPGEDIRAWRKRYRPLLGVLAAAQTSLTREQLVAFTEVNKQTVEDVLVDVQQFLDRTGAGKNRYRLYHQSVIDFLGNESEAGEFWINLGAVHHEISAYYWDQYGDRWSDCDEYGLRYQSVHLIESQDWEGVTMLLTDFHFLEAKCRRISVYELESDYHSVLAQWQGGQEDQEMLQAFEDRLRLESHHIHRAPELLFPQLYNHLTWLDAPDGPIHQACVQGRVGRTGWLRGLQDPRPDPPSWSCSLKVHTDKVNAVAVTPNGRYVVSGSEDDTLKVWEIESARLLRSLEKHTGSVKTVAVTPDGKHVVSGSKDKTLKVWELESGQLLRSLEGHTGSVNAVAVTPDGQHVVSGSADNTLKVWELESGRLLRSLEGHTGSVNAVAMTPDGQHVVSGSGVLDIFSDNTVKLWELESGRLLRSLEGHTGRVMSVAVTPDGQHLISGAADGTVKMWELESGQLLRSLEGHTGTVMSVAVTPDGQHVVSGFKYNTVKVWDLASGRLLCTLEGHIGGVTAVAVTPDEQHVVSVSYDGTMKVWELATGRLLHSREVHIDTVWTMAVTPDGQHVVSGSTNHTVGVWEIESERLLRSLEGHTESVTSVAVTPDGQHVVSGSDDNTLKVWELESGRLLRSLEGHTDWVRAVAVTPNGQHVVSGSGDSTVGVWELASGQMLRSLEGHTDPVYAVAVTPDGAHVVSGSDDTTVKVWELESGRLLCTLEGHINSVRAVAVTPDGQHVVSGSRDNALRLWELLSRRLLRSLKGHTGGVSTVAVTPDGQHVISGSYNGTVKVWELGNERPLRSLEGHTDPVCAVAVTPDGAHVVSGTAVSGLFSRPDDTTVKVWELESGRLLRSLGGHACSVWALAVTPDGQHLVSASGVQFSSDNTVKVWELESGRLLRSLEGHNSGVYAVAVTPDGQHVVSGSDDTTVKVWKLASGRLLRSLGRYKHHVNAMAVTPDVQQLVSGSSDNTIKVWELESGQMLRSLEGHTESVTSVAVTPDGQHVVSGSGDNTVKVWELESGQMLRSLEGHTESVTSVAVTPDGQHAVSGSKDKTLKVWELVTGNSSVLLSNDSSILSLALSHDGHWLVCGDAVGRVWIFEWVDAALGAPIITPWKNLSPKWIFWNRKESMAFGCPFCKVWSPISESALGAYLPCPACGETVRFTSFTIEANWRPMAGI